MKKALIVIDMQKGCCLKNTSGSLEGVCLTINKAIDYFRNHSMQVIWVQHINPKKACTPEIKNLI